MVRTNPVTGWKAVFVNPVFTREIDNVPDTESKWILQYIDDLIAKKLQYQVRFHWQPNSVAIWDNRSTYHTGVYDFHPYFRRGVRVTVSGELPYFDPKSGTQAESWKAIEEAIIAKQEAAARASTEAGTGSHPAKTA